MFADEMNAEQVIETLRGFGLDLFVSEDGVVHGKFREAGKTMTLEMRAVVDRLRELNDPCAAILRKEETVVLEGLTVEEAIQIGEKVKAGELELLGMVHYHSSTGLVDMTVKGGKKHGG